MNLTNEELIKLVETNDSQCLEFEEAVVNYTNIERWELETYVKNTMIVTLGLIKLKQITMDETLEKCLDDLHK